MTQGRVDRVLISSARLGDIAAFDALIDRYYARVVAYLTRLTGDRELADDLTQETFASAYQALQSLINDESFTAWLYRIARNRWHMELRRRRRLRWLSLERIPQRQQHEDQVLTQPGLEAHSIAVDQVQQALNGLSPPLREALLLHHLWGYSGREVAEILSISPAAAQKRISRAAEEFRRCYQRLTEDEFTDEPL